MSNPQPAIRPPFRLARQLGLQSPVLLWLAFLASTVLHGSLVALAIYLWFPHQTETTEEEPADFHAVGLIVKPKANQQSRNNPDGPETPSTHLPATRFASNDATSSRPQEVPNRPPVKPSLPSGGIPTIGPGAATPNFFPGGEPNLLLPNGIQDAASSATRSLGNGEATFFTINEKGKRLVYVVDRSGSMIHDRAMALAKQQLIRSLNGLTEKHQLQIIFYNENATVLTIDNGSPQQLILATPRNLEKVKQRIGSIQPDGGTRHMAALRPALNLRPDAIYFLTDAGSELQQSELEEIRRLNKGKTRIHCIKFGKGADLLSERNFLKHLADMTGGSYYYHDVQRQLRR